MELQLSNYQEYKEALDNQLKSAAEGFVRIGYLLKLARDTDILAGSGYANVNEFAKAEYSMDKSMVSRFININTKFAENGCSEYLKEQYRGFGYAKLAIMLQLPDVINETLTPDLSKSEIQSIKDEVDEERKVSDIEVLIEGEKEEQKVLDSNLAKALHQLCEDEPDLFVQLYKEFKELGGLEDIKEILAPADTKIYSIRLQGIGRVMLSLQTDEKYIFVIKVRENIKEQYTWPELYECLEKLLTVNRVVEGAEGAWECIYEREFPKSVEVAPVQPEEKKKAVKDSKVTKAKPEKEKKNEKREEVAEKSESAHENPQTEKTIIEPKSSRETEPSGEEVGRTEDKTSEESMDENIPVEVIPECDVTVEEKTVETAKIPNAGGEILAVPQHCKEGADKGQQDMACEIDLTFKERIQTAEWILEAVKRDNKSDARLYCHELLKLLGEFE